MSLDKIYELFASDQEDDALDALYDWIDGLLTAGEFEAVDEALAAVDLPRLSTVGAVGFLTITLAVNDRPARLAFFERVEAWLHQGGCRRVESLLRGLR